MSKNIRFLEVQLGNRFLAIVLRYTQIYTKPPPLVLLLFLQTAEVGFLVVDLVLCFAFALHCKLPVLRAYDCDCTVLFISVLLRPCVAKHRHQIPSKEANRGNSFHAA